VYFQASDLLNEEVNKTFEDFTLPFFPKVSEALTSSSPPVRFPILMFLYYHVDLLDLTIFSLTSSPSFSFLSICRETVSSFDPVKYVTSTSPSLANVRKL